MCFCIIWLTKWYILVISYQLLQRWTLPLQVWSTTRHCCLIFRATSANLVGFFLLAVGWNERPLESLLKKLRILITCVELGYGHLNRIDLQLQASLPLCIQPKCCVQNNTPLETGFADLEHASILSLYLTRICLECENKLSSCKIVPFKNPS